MFSTKILTSSLHNRKSPVNYKIIISSDWHYPYISEKAVSRIEDLAKAEQPDIFVIAGDFLDCSDISKYPKVPVKRMRLKEELEGGRSLLSELRQVIPDAKIIYIAGNHDFRIRQYLIRQSPEIYEFLELRHLMNFAKLKIDFVDTKPEATKFIDTFIKLDGWVIGHADKALQEPGASVRWLMEKRFPGNSVVQGHCHKTAMVVKRRLDDNLIFGIETGCMCDVKSSYTSERNWVNSCVLIEDGAPRIIFL